MSDDLVARPRRTIEGDKAGAGAAEGETWRVTPLTRPGMGVMVDAWHQLPLDPAHPVYARTDLIAEQLLPGGDRDVRAFTGTASIVGELPPLPDGYRAIATIRVLPGQTAIIRCHIGAAR